MKKLVTWTLALSLALPLVACGGGKKAETKSETVAASEASGEAEKPFTIQPFQAVDKQDYGIRVDGYMTDEIDNGFISFRLQNKSETVSYRFLLDSFTGDGIRLYGPINKVVEPGQETSVQLPIRTNPDYKLQDFGDLEFRFLVQDSKLSVYTPEKDEVFHIYPNGENSKVHYTWKEKEGDKLLDENAYFKATNTGVTKDKYGNYVLNLYLENRSDKLITLYIQGGAVNGIPIEMNNFHVVGAGQAAFVPIFWDHSYVEGTKVEEIQNLSFNLFVDEGNTFVMSEHPALEKTYTVEP